MITSLEIENFKGFRKLELPKLTRITLLGGKNNVGKTSLLEAIFAFFNHYDPQILTRLLSTRGANSLPPIPEMMWGPIFHNFDTSKTVTIQIAVDNEPEKFEVSYDPTFTLQSFTIPQPANGMLMPTTQAEIAPSSAAALNLIFRRKDSEDVARLILFAGQLQAQTEKLQIKNYPIVFDVVRLMPNLNDLANRFGQLDIIGKQERVVEFMRVIEPNLKALTVIPTGNQPLIYGDIGLSRKIPIAYMGEGMQRMLEYVVSMATNENGTLLIDDALIGIHHSVLPAVWAAIAKAAREFNCQIIATTHSYECLRAALEGIAGVMASDLSYIRLDRREDCVCPVYLDYETLETAIEYNMEIR